MSGCSSAAMRTGCPLPPHLGPTNRVVHHERSLGAPLVLELQAHTGLHLALALTGGDLLAVGGRFVVPQRVGGRGGARFGPPVSDEAARHVTRGILGAVPDLPCVPRRVGAPCGVGVQLRGGVLLLLVPRGGRQCRGLLPFVLQHEALCRPLRIHRDRTALPHFGGLPVRRFAAGEYGKRESGGEPAPGPARPSRPSHGGPPGAGWATKCPTL